MLPMCYENNRWEMWNRVIAKQIIALECSIQWPLVFNQPPIPQDPPDHFQCQAS